MTREEAYAKYRGRCKEFSVKLVEQHPDLRLVRGHYYCPYWGKQAHWWTEDANGVIHDPTAEQFPSHGTGEYIEFDGTLECAECGKEMTEQEARFDSNYGFCSTKCNMRFVGL